MGYVNADGTKLDLNKEKVLQQAEDKLVKARELLRRCRTDLADHFASDPMASNLFAEITDFIGD